MRIIKYGFDFTSKFSNEKINQFFDELILFIEENEYQLGGSIQGYIEPENINHSLNENDIDKISDWFKNRNECKNIELTLVDGDE